MCVQLLTKLIYSKVPTWHAEEMRQLALVSAVDTIELIKLIQTLVRQIQQALLGCRKGARERITRVIQERYYGIGCIPG
jgi:hypothetical protein